MAAPVTDEHLWAALKQVMDPEIPISLVDLGMIYGARMEGNTAVITMTFTATSCPCMSWIQDDIRERLLREPGVEAVEIHLVWDPPWTAEMISEEGKQQMRTWGIST